ncbi:MAG: carbohydrate-binding domain-containing protein [Ruminococcus sp.]|nr:carbohydrate-binding domain-containing protein [Ruminococcus sp.]
MKKAYIISAVLAALTAAAMTACGNKQTSETASQSSAAETSVSAAAETNESEDTTEAAAAKAENKDSSAEIKQISNTQNDLFTERDLEQTADLSNAKTIKATDDKTVDITEEGVYVISGSAENFTVRVDADDTAKVQLVLDGVDIENDDFPVIYVISADKVFVTTTDSDNTLTVSGQFTADGETNTDAVIFSKDDLVLNGTGTLSIISNYGNGITGKDDMKITGGTYSVKCALDAFEANDSISVCGGTFDIEADKDGFHCENDNAEGTVIISGGSFTISAGSDGIQACALLQTDGGDFDITASEGFEATNIVINDGNIDIYASDDGINATGDSADYEVAVTINGGNLNVEVGPGDTDAIDANGSVYINGGTISITAQMSSFDYDRTAEFNGGTLIINGEEVSEIPQSMMMGGGHGGFGSEPPTGDFGGEPPTGGFGGGRGGYGRMF